MNLEEFQIRVGEGTPYAATLTCTPFDEAVECLGNEWFGRIKFDNDLLNWPYEMPRYEGGSFTMYNEWQYPEYKTSGTHLMNLLENWHKEIVSLFERVKATQI